MVHFLLGIRAKLESLTNLQPQGGCNDPNFTYLFKLKCEGCGELTEKEIGVRLSLGNGKGAPHLVRKCKFCEREGSVTMMADRGRPLTQTGLYSPLMMFNCKGYEPVDFVFSGGWKVESVAGTSFDNVDLSKGEFSGYDERGEFPVMISKLHATFTVVTPGRPGYRNFVRW
ncbi:hypothetical protein M0R45_011782 [Rubus argutus]|uniref:CXXC motif containing zinc binding protein n=1 Tax=Rubus argutus TaxID=59490 RepID=A0AAW1YBA5_RUBAR